MSTSEELDPVPDTQVGAKLIRSIAEEVELSKEEILKGDYNERYIDKGPAWKEHTDYGDRGSHAQTHRATIRSS